MELNLILLVLLMIIVIEVTSIENELRTLEPGQNINGEIKAMYMAHIVEWCKIMSTRRGSVEC